MPPRLEGWSHVALSVTDLDRSVAWYGRVLGMQTLFPYDTDDFTRRILGHPSGVVLALTVHGVTADDDAFDPTRVGLDHVSLRVADEEALADWVAHLDDQDVAHGGVQHSAATGSALVAAPDPDGIQVEFYVQTGAPS